MGKKLLKYTLVAIICILLFSSGKPILAASVSENNQANQGVLDLSNWDWDTNKTIALDGQWELYWEELYSPEDFKLSGTVITPEYIKLPRAWNKFMVNGNELSGDGYATYRLNITNIDERILAIKLPRIFTSYKLWANGEIIASAGKVGTNRSEMAPQYLPQVSYFTPKDNQIELVIQVANFRHRSGGILESIRLGEYKQIADIRNKKIAMDLFLFGSLFVIGFYHIALYLFRIKDRTNLYFGIYALLVSARTLLVGEIFLIYLYPNFNWEIAHKIQTIAYYMGVPLVILFMKSTYSKEVSARLSKIILIIGAVFSAVVLITPARIFNRINTLYQVFTILVISYLIYVVIVTIYKKRENSWIIGIGLSIMILFIINDIVFLSTWLADAEHVFLRKIFTRGNLSSYGLLIFVFTQSMVLAKKFSKSFITIERLSLELKAINTHLAERVLERTLDLELSQKKLEKAYQSATKSEKALADFTQNISHDLRTPITAIKGYVLCILDGIISDENQQKKYLLRVMERINQMNSMVQDLLDLSMLQTKQISFSFIKITLAKFIQVILDKYSLDMASSNVNFEVWNSIDEALADQSQNISPQSTTLISDLEISIDTQNLDRVFVNLFSNAIKYSIGQAKISILFELINDYSELLVKVADSGIGIPAEDIPYIFDRSYKAKGNQKAEGNTSNGLGLAIAKEIIAYHGGRIWVESEKGVGSCFFFTIPICD